MLAGTDAQHAAWKTCGPTAFIITSSCRNLVSDYILHFRKTCDPNATGPSSFYCTIISPSPSLCFSPSRSVIVRWRNMWPEHRTIQDSVHVSNSSLNNCRVNEHTARNVPPSIMDSRHSCWRAFMQSRLMLIISHSVTEEADGGTPRTHLTGLAVNKAGGRVVADWLPGHCTGNLDLILKFIDFGDILEL